MDRTLKETCLPILNEKEKLPVKVFDDFLVIKKSFFATLGTLGVHLVYKFG